MATLALSSSAKADPIVLGNGSVTGTIVGTSVNEYSFVVFAGSNVTFSISSHLPNDPTTNRGEPRLRLYDAGHILLQDVGGGPVTGFVYSFNQPGHYLLAVSSLSPFDPPSFGYTLTVSGVTSAQTPEPISMVLLATGLGGLAANSLRKRKRKNQLG
jgi:hypothetical protein